MSLDLRLEPLHCFEIWSILRRGATIIIMLNTLNTHTFFAEATSVVSVLPCWHRVDAKRQSGYVRALAGRHAR